MGKIVEIRIRDGDTVTMLDYFKLGGGYTKTFALMGEPLNTPEHPHDDKLVMVGYEFKPKVINLKATPKPKRSKK